MTSVVIVFGSTYGNTQEAAENLAGELFDRYDIQISMENVDDVDLNDLEDFDKILLGCSTWHDGKLQDSWDLKLDDLDKVNLAGKQVGLFGAGDQMGYGDTFQDALGILGQKIRERGAKLVGFTSIADYDFSKSAGVENNQFMGLALDYDNQIELNGSRIKAWAVQIGAEMNLSLKAVAA